MFKRGMSAILAVALVLGGICTRPALALAGESGVEEEHNTDILETQEATSTPDETAPALVSPQPDIIVTHSHDYEYQWSFPDNWRNGVSGGSNIADMTLTFDYSNEEGYDIGFTAEIAGDKTVKIGTISAHFGFNYGEHETKSLGAGASVVVPKGHHYTIRYRPIVAIYKVTEYTYYTYRVGLSCETKLVGTKECTVAVFDRWDFDAIETTDLP